MCGHIANIEELSVYCWLVNNGVPEEHFMKVLSLKKTDTKSIYLALLDWMKNSNMQFNGLVHILLPIQNVWEKLLFNLKSHGESVIAQELMETK